MSKKLFMLKYSKASVRDCSKYSHRVYKGLSTTNQNCGAALKLKKINKVKSQYAYLKLKFTFG